MIRILVGRTRDQVNFQVHPKTMERCSGPPLIGVSMSMEDLKSTQRINVIAYMLTGQEDREVQFIEAATGEVLHSCFSQKQLAL